MQVLQPDRSHTQTPLTATDTVQRKCTGQSAAMRRSELADLLECPVDEDETVVELLRCESSPIYASRPSSTIGKMATSTTPVNSEGYWIDVERNLRFMDEQNDAAFTDWIKNERNLSLSLPHIKRVMYEYSLERICNGLRWLIQDWRLASIAAAIKFLLLDDIWTPAASSNKGSSKKTSRLCVNGQRYRISIQHFRDRIHIIMALIDGWDFSHVRELFHFLCTSACNTTEQSSFLLQALLLAFPESTPYSFKLKKALIQAFF